MVRTNLQPLLDLVNKHREAVHLEQCQAGDTYLNKEPLTTLDAIHLNTTMSCLGDTAAMLLEIKEQIEAMLSTPT